MYSGLVDRAAICCCCGQHRVAGTLNASAPPWMTRLNRVDGIWALRANVTAYDAAYVILARLLGATLVTRDTRLAKAPGLGIPVVVP
ncbi:MAG: type II toxin-antitoxin system VapC family toxin [Xanthomonadales bacterium]|nr:type II toxin-antitoxin system VapC family toxin [Xanthomonadales bacterium]